MPDSKQANDVAGYAAEVRVALAHLPDAEREILLEDLESHLEEVASESGLPLQERLGRPADYAAELRSAYGAADTSVTKVRSTRRDAQAVIRAVIGTNTYRDVAALLPELRPGWWVLRGYLAVLFLAFAVKGEYNLHPVPNPFTSFGLLEILAMVAAIAISVRIGRRGVPSGRVWRGIALAANVAIALLALPVFAGMGTNHYTLSTMDSGAYASAYQGGYYGPGVSNIYPYTKDGKPLKDVLLYDQNGRPLTIGWAKDPGVITEYPVAADGRSITNEYPLNQRHQNGDPVLPPRVAFPPTSSTSASSPTPSASPTPTP
jgi:uncharacterized membrane protein